MSVSKVINVVTGEITETPLSDDEIAERAARLVEEQKLTVREKRNKLLKQTDWMAMSDLTLSTEWASYRQALRDVPAQSGFPNNITWPSEPG
tara:strand:- start:632 stop:907 length:276 start_codon:yes stop_codon:yes gene_type:complete